MLVIASVIGAAGILSACTLPVPSEESRGRGPAADRLPGSTTAVGASAWGVAVDERREALWVSDPSRGVVMRLDREGRVTGEHPTGDEDPRAAGLQVVDDSVWVVSLGGTVTILDALSGARLSGVTVGPGEPAAILVRGAVAWVPLHGPSGGLDRLDTTTLRPLGAVALPESAFAVAGAGSAVWVAGLEGRAFGVDATTGELLQTVDVGAAPRGIAAGAGSVWVSLRDDSEVVRIDPRTGKVQARIPIDGQPWPVGFGAGFLWVATLEGQVFKIDPERDEVVATGDAAPQPRAIAVGLGAVWVTSQTGSITRIPVAEDDDDRGALSSGRRDLRRRGIDVLRDLDGVYLDVEVAEGGTVARGRSRARTSQPLNARSIAAVIAQR